MSFDFRTERGEQYAVTSQPDLLQKIIDINIDYAGYDKEMEKLYNPLDNLFWIYEASHGYLHGDVACVYKSCENFLTHVREYRKKKGLKPIEDITKSDVEQDKIRRHEIEKEIYQKYFGNILEK